MSDADLPPGPGTAGRCGVLLHPTALPGTPGCGSFGAAAHAWIDLLADHGIDAWQLLPLAPADGTGSPYSSPSGFALNAWFLDGDALVADGFLEAADLAALPPGRTDRLDLEACPLRSAALAQALERRWLQQSAERQVDFQRWCQAAAPWLVEHCRFMVLRELQGGLPWWQWPVPLAQRQWRALRRFDREQAAALRQEALVQWHLERQWQQLHDHARHRGVQLIGDLPFYVAHDSADVWARRRLFSLRRDGSLTQQSGVPPDYFSDTGQLWGTPVYRWSLHRFTGFRWWLRRLQGQLERLDLLRLDHFRALESYWAVPGEALTAQLGEWRASPGVALLRALRQRLGGQLPLIAEDLGVITPAVEALRDRFRLPGMKILQFAFDGNDGNAYLPENYVGRHWVVYTGTHDNATCIGWWDSLPEDQRRQVGERIGDMIEAPGWQLLELALASRAELAVVPLQDLLSLGDQARFNTPGTAGEANWSWRLEQPVQQLSEPIAALAALAARYGRSAGGATEGSAAGAAAEPRAAAGGTR